jgi:hypothetical protein
LIIKGLIKITLRIHPTMASMKLRRKSWQELYIKLTRSKKRLNLIKKMIWDSNGLVSITREAHSTEPRISWEIGPMFISGIDNSLPI